MYRPDDRNDTSPRGKATGFISRKVVEVIEKFCIPCVAQLFTTRERQISSMEAEESLQ